ncbi:putative multidrug resistance protein fnx1 [Annulohypoxylon moriforme]|nr:putative multidrug resistance protein fnx1 [Annulohypoxylon moriforme]
MEPERRDKSSSYGWQFWSIIGSLSIMSILSALDISAMSTALPSIIKDLGSGYAYIWVANAYFLTSAAFQPLYGQTANIFGRRSLTLFIVFIFAVGSAISGPAPSLGALIVGRAVQGMGGGGINVMIDMIVCDLVPLRERSKFIGIIFGTFSVAVAIGPLIGGSLAERVSWRWVFYLNLPIASVSWLALAMVLRVRYKKDSIQNSLKRVDLGGNALLIASMVALLIALAWGGTEFSWASWQTLVPLILGFAGLFAFLAVQTRVPEPTMPLRLFNSRTSIGSYGLTFIHSVLSYWVVYFLPLYFQAVLEATPITSGVDLLPTVVVSMPFAIIAGVGLSKFGRYRPWHFVGVALFAISFGLFSLLDENSTRAYWAGVQCIGAAGAGILTTTTLPAAQSALEEKDQAVATATWAFIRSFGAIWGAAIPAAIFNSRVNELLTRIPDENLRNRLANGGAYGLATGNFITSLNYDPSLKALVKSVYVDSLKLCWQVGIGFCLLGFLIALVVKEIPMRTELETEFGMEEREQQRGNEATKHEQEPGALVDEGVGSST